MVVDFRPNNSINCPNPETLESSSEKAESEQRLELETLSDLDEIFWSY